MDEVMKHGKMIDGQMGMHLTKDWWYIFFQ